MDSVVRLFARDGDRRDGDFAESAEEIRKFARSHKDWNVYVAPNPTCSRVGVRHSARDVTHWSYLLLDVDPIKRGASPRLFLSKALWILQRDTGCDLSKAIWVNSGRGVQAWIRLAAVLLDDVTPTREIHSVANDDDSLAISRSVARRVNGYWLKHLNEAVGVAYGCRLDTSVSDLPRVMRCPGTVNQKTGRRASFIAPSNYIFSSLATLLVEGTPAQELVDPPAPEGLPAGMSWQEVFPHLTLTAQTYLTFGKSEPGRHKVVWHVAKKLKEVGVGKAEARRALRWGNKLKGKGEELPLEQLEYALSTAYDS